MEFKKELDLFNIPVQRDRELIAVVMLIWFIAWCVVNNY